MKTVYIRYPSSTGSKTHKLLVSDSTTVEKLRPLIIKSLPQFWKNDFFLAHDCNGSIFPLSETSQIAQCQGSKKIKLQLTLNSVTTFVEFPDLSIKEITINTRKSTLQNIQEIIGEENSEYYVLAFRLFDDPSVVRTAALSFPLSFQGWTCEKLYLIRRVTPSNLIRLSDEKTIHDYYLNCKKILELKLTIFMNQTLVMLGVLQYRVENCSGSKTINIQDLLNILPNWVIHSVKNDEHLEKYLNNARNSYMKLSKIDAELEYVKIATNQGSLCFFYDTVKFQIVERKWKVKTNRHLYISPTLTCISKAYCGKPHHQGLTSTLKSIKLEGDTVIYSFESGKTWKVRSEHPKILYAASKEIYDISKNEVIENNEVYNSIEHDIVENNFDEQQNDPDEEYFVPFMNSKEPSENNTQNVDVQPGISLTVCPDEIGPDEPYSIDDKFYRDLKIVEELKIIPYKKDNSKPNDNSSSFLFLMKFYLGILTIILIISSFKK